jgi:hypothetical protein
MWYYLDLDDGIAHVSRQLQPPDIETRHVRDVASLRSVRREPVVAGLINEYHLAA